MIENYKENISEAVEYIKSKTNSNPKYGLILGSGLGELGDEVENKVVISYNDIPHFKQSTAPSHAGNLVIGKLAGKDVVIMQGRLHLYEGYTPQEATFPVRVMKHLGVESLIVTCASGGLNRNFEAGDLMLINDQLNMTGYNTLMGKNDPEEGPRFPVMFECFNRNYRELAKKVALENSIKLQEGIYVGISGPTFLTRAELRHVTQIGADSVGMSVIQEVIAAIHSGLKVLGIANITDMALPDVEHHSSEQEILATAKKTGPIFRKLLKSILEQID